MVEEDETAGKTPEECRDLGLWEVDLVYYSLNGNNKGDSTKNKRGKAYKARSDSEYKCFEAHDGVLYRPGDHVFIEVSQCDPYYIGTISNFKMTKRDQLSVKVTRFYRPEDVPEDSYSLLLQDRKDDISLNHVVMAAMQTRELFSSEISSVHPICHLRTHCIYFLTVINIKKSVLLNIDEKNGFVKSSQDKFHLYVCVNIVCQKTEEADMLREGSLSVND
ncbi:unnamed protein product [Onchocerca ochengi]|uniref:BAH domain-containing protein n=1 Tax=Onchocerca ochengi TaxID=42157 RepID=A0A182EBA5_ONCOC|nr:unnamed protein product [Onchocerca ochengi]